MQAYQVLGREENWRNINGSDDLLFKKKILGPGTLGSSVTGRTHIKS